MNILGITLSKPTFTQVTWSALMATVWWVALLGLWKASGGTPDVLDAGAMLLMIFWGCICPRVGIRLDRGFPHLALNLVIGGVILTAFQGAVGLFLH